MSKVLAMVNVSKLCKYVTLIYTFGAVSIIAPLFCLVLTAGSQLLSARYN